MTAGIFRLKHKNAAHRFNRRWLYIVRTHRAEKRTWCKAIFSMARSMAFGFKNENLKMLQWVQAFKNCSQIILRLTRFWYCTYWQTCTKSNIYTFPWSSEHLGTPLFLGILFIYQDPGALSILKMDPLKVASGDPWWKRSLQEGSLHGPSQSIF